MKTLEPVTNLNEMVGQTFTKVTADGRMLHFSNDRVKYSFFHQQDCCEDVGIEDIVGDLQDLENLPLLVAREDSNADFPAPYAVESYTWTFYTFATHLGYVTVRFLGVSNGYYSESVDCWKKILTH